MSICPSVHMSVCLAIVFSISLTVCLSIYLSICLSICQSIYVVSSPIIPLTCHISDYPSICLPLSVFSSSDASDIVEQAQHAIPLAHSNSSGSGSGTPILIHTLAGTAGPGGATAVAPSSALGSASPGPAAVPPRTGLRGVMGAAAASIVSAVSPSTSSNTPTRDGLILIGSSGQNNNSSTNTTNSNTNNNNVAAPADHGVVSRTSLLRTSMPSTTSGNNYTNDNQQCQYELPHAQFYPNITYSLCSSNPSLSLTLPSLFTALLLSSPCVLLPSAAVVTGARNVLIDRRSSARAAAGGDTEFEGGFEMWGDGESPSASPRILQVGRQIDMLEWWWR